LVRFGVSTAFVLGQISQARGSARSREDSSLDSQTTVVVNHAFVEGDDITGRRGTGTSGIRRAFAGVKGGRADSVISAVLSRWYVFTLEGSSVASKSSGANERRAAWTSSRDAFNSGTVSSQRRSSNVKVADRTITNGVNVIVSALRGESRIFGNANRSKGHGFSTDV